MVASGPALGLVAYFRGQAVYFPEGTEKSTRFHVQSCPRGNELRGSEELMHWLY